MAAMDEAWRVADTSKDPAEVARALARAKLCGQFAASARKIAAMTPGRAKPAVQTPQRPAPRPFSVPSDAGPDQEPAPSAQAVIARSALERLKAGGGRRGRL